MLQNMRDNMKGTIAFIIVGFLAFILAASLINLNGNSQHNAYGDVARVNDLVISERDLQIAIAQDRQRLQAQFGGNLPDEFFSDDRLRQPALENLVRQRLLLDKAVNGAMTVSDAELDSIIVQSDDFKIDGVFDQDLFVQRVRRIGYTPLSYRDLLRERILIGELESGLANSAFVTDADVQKMVQLSRQTRDISWMVLPLGELPSTMTFTGEDLASHYEENKSRYVTDEQVSIEYLELGVDAFLDSIDVSEEDARSQYEQEVAQLADSVEREAAHIMIEAGSDRAEERLAELQTKLDANEDFAELALAYSDDFGTKETGGNLGFSSGDAFPPEFEQALSGLEVGQVSTAVAVDGNTHFIKLLGQTEAEAPTFEESRARIETEIKRLQAEEIYIEKLNELKDVAYNAESLKEVADQLALDYGTTGLFTAAGGEEAVLEDQRVVAAAFNEQVLQQGFTELLELSPSRTVVVNLLEHQPVRTLTLEEKREDIIAEVQLEKAGAALSEKADAYVQQMRDGKSLTILSSESLEPVNSRDAVSRNQAGIDSALLEHVFALSRPADEDLFSTTKLANNDYAVVVLHDVKDGDFAALSDEEKQGVRLSLARNASLGEYQAWQTEARKAADVEILTGDSI